MGPWFNAIVLLAMAVAVGGFLMGGTFGVAMMIGGGGLSALCVVRWVFLELRPYDPWRKYRKRSPLDP